MRLPLTLALALIAAPAIAQPVPPAPPAPPSPSVAPMAGDEDRAPPHRMMRPMTRDQAEQHARRHFARIDADHDGVVTRAEFDAMRGIRSAAADHAGLAATPPSTGGDASPPSSSLHAAMDRPGDMFDRLDADHDGKLTEAEMTSQADRMFDRHDTNHDGKISERERAAVREGQMRHDGGGFAQ